MVGRCVEKEAMCACIVLSETYFVVVVLKRRASLEEDYRHGSFPTLYNRLYLL